MLGLGTLPGHVGSRALGVSAGGSVVVGASVANTVNAHDNEAFRWTELNGMQGIGTLPGYVGSEAFNVSADGRTIVGVGLSQQSGQAFRWTESGGMVGLGDLPGGHSSSFATAVSADGLVTVGEAPPGSSVLPLPPTSPVPFLVQWEGTDDAGGEGIASFDIYVSVDQGAFTESPHHLNPWGSFDDLPIQRLFPISRMCA